MDNILSIRNLVVSFASDGAKERAVAVNGVDIDIPAGKTVGLVGESGCGKSVTSLSVMGLLAENGRVEAGSVMFGGQDLLKLSDRQLREIRGNRISMIFQEPMTSLNPVITVGKQVAESLRLHIGLDKRAAKAKTIEIFEKVGIPEPQRRYSCYPHQLSGGLRQRVMIGMAMVLKPDLLIADEPTTALDVSIEAQILRLMRDLRRESGTSILMITHNLGVVAEICDMVYVMYAGEVVERADVFTLFQAGAHPYTRGLMASLPRMTPKGQRLYNIKGTVPNLRAMPAGCRFAHVDELRTVAVALLDPVLQQLAHDLELGKDEALAAAFVNVV
ncbi:MAG: ABC transporter ATP-binding protein, partial [Clostridia bacterium]|nr:ABC transporter ATP-binding protein [Clostridia bacterium]